MRGEEIEAAHLVDLLQAFVFREIELTDAEAERAMKRLDELVPDMEADDGE